MGDSSLQERLRGHAKAFDGLLSLIPAKMYYGEDSNDNWRQKKQTKDEAKAARRGKLDPDSELNRNAKEVMDERARSKRKLQEMQEEDEGDWEDEEEGDIEWEKPGEGLRKKPEQDESSPKKPRLSGANAVESRAVKEKRKAKQEKKRVKKEERKEERKEAKRQLMAEKEQAVVVQTSQAAQLKSGSTPAKDDVKPSTEADEEDAQGTQDMEPIDVSGIVSRDTDASPESSPASAPASPVFDGPGKPDSAELASTETSISSAIAPSEKPKYIKLPSDTTALRARLAAKIEALRAARKADGPDGKPIRTRQELIEARREKQAQRKAHKKELRQKTKEEEDRKREEALASARNSPGSILSPMVDRDDDQSANHFAFGRIAFADGTQMSHDLSYEKSGPDVKKKGPSDPKTQLLKVQAQKSRIANMNEDKRKEVMEKEAWLAARRRTEGEKIHDNETLLKKAIKRKDKAKKKSEKEWKDRSQGVENAIKEKQKKREDNLRKRREDKHSKGKKKGGASKKKNRPGFEGGFGGSSGKRK
ncbi:SURF6-domain-containing protein [Thozetella sp. PMI_491]|nr:SURF6-domain-containing protein [Thozetella sp. PMI_491]